MSNKNSSIVTTTHTVGEDCNSRRNIEVFVKGIFVVYLFIPNSNQEANDDIEHLSQYCILNA